MKNEIKTRWRFYKRVWDIVDDQKEISFAHFRYFDMETEAKKYLEDNGGIMYKKDDYQFTEQNIEEVKE